MNKTQDDLLKDPAFKRFGAAVDRAVAAFDTIVEWTEYIVFLGRLQKALQEYRTFRAIPSKLVVSSRLARCLNPSLPSGVHQRTLELYTLIFSQIGLTGLAEDLKVWLPGLLPLFKYASLVAKSQFLTLFEAFIVPLGASFRQAEKSVILALLPGLEEENGEYFEKTLDVIDQIRLAVKEEESFFWQSMWLATATSAEQRVGACNYCLKRMESLDKSGKETLYASPDPGLFIRSFCAGLTDLNPLVQRGFLELLVKNVPLSLPLLQNSPGDLERLLLSAISVVLRRDMSLNRRLYVWLLGADSHSSYFPKYALRPLTHALKKLLIQQGNLPPDPIRVSKTALALLDKWEIGGYLMPELFTPVMETVFAKPDASILSSARALFDSMDPAVIWAELFSWIEKGRAVMLIWVVDKFNLREEEMLVRHVPQVLLYILCLLRHNLLQGQEWFVLARKLIQLLPSRAFTSSKGVDLGAELADMDFTQFAREYYGKVSSHAGIDAALPESIRGTYFHRHLLKIFRSVGMLPEPNVPDYSLEWTSLLGEAAKITPPLPEFRLLPVLDNLNQNINKRQGFQFLGAVIDTTNALVKYQHVGKDVFEPPTTLVPSQPNHFISLPETFVHLLWRNLDPHMAAYHVESVTYIWSLTSFLPSTTVEQLVANEVERSSHTEGDKAQTCARFSVLWKHAVDRSGTAAILTKPMMLVLRFLKGEESSSGRMGVERWLASLGNSAHRMFDIIFSKLLEDRLLRLPVQKEYKDITVLFTPCSPGSEDLTTLSYHLDLLLEIFRFENQYLRAVCADDKAMLDPSRLELLEKNGLTSTDMTYAVLLVRICLRALFVELSTSADTTQTAQLRHLHLLALRVLQEVMSFTPSLLTSDIPIGLTLLKKLYMTIDDTTQHLQPPLMDALLLIFRRDGGLKSLVPKTPTPQGLSRQRSITGKKSHIKENVEDALGPTSLLLHTVLDALSFSGCRPLVTIWSKFFLECLPYFSDSVFPILIPTVECVGREISSTLLGLQQLFGSVGGDGVDLLEQSVTLLTLLEGVLFRAHEILRIEEAKLGGSKGGYDGAGFLNNVMSGVWGGEGILGRSGVANNRLTVLLCIHDVVKLCYDMWSWEDRLRRSEELRMSNQSREYTSEIMKDTSRRIMQRIHSVEKLECFEVLIEIRQNRGDNVTSESVFGLLKILNGYKENQAFSLFVDALNSRTNPSSLEPSRRSSLSTTLTTTSLTEALYAFVKQLELSSVAEINQDCLVFLKDCISNTTTFKTLYGNLLAVATVYGEKLDDCVIADKKKMRKDSGEIYIKLLTLAVNQNPHPRSTSMEGRRITLYQPENNPESDDEASKPGIPDLSSQEFLSPPTLERPGTAKGEAPLEIIKQLTTSVVPKLSAILDQEKVLASCMLIMNHIIGPATRKRTLYSSSDSDVLDLFLELVKVPGSIKSWRREVNDAFNENAFFTMSPERGAKWKIILKTFLMNDKERVVDFISRISAATSSILRSSRDQDRLVNVRRLALILISGDMDQFIAHTGAIKEKLAELGRTASIDPIHGEVFVLFRALMLRFSPIHLIAFWPMIVSEIQILFSQVLEQSGVVTKEQLPLFFEACKVLDMMLVVGSEDFQLQEWIFITDTIEAVYRSPNSRPSALIDRLAIRMGSGLNISGSRGNSLSDDEGFQKTVIAQRERPDYRPLRRPIIKATSCESVSELIPFMSHLSVVMYESGYELSGPADLDACDKQVLEDIFRSA